MDIPMSKEESYVDRRQLFKNIWDTAMTIEDKEGNVINKPKIIKTLRLDDVDNSAGKKNKQRIKNLRTVCNKLLDFCDRQEADEICYKEMLSNGTEPPTRKQKNILMKKLKAKNRKRKANRARNMYTSINNIPHSLPMSQDRESGTTTPTASENASYIYKPLVNMESTNTQKMKVRDSLKREARIRLGKIPGIKYSEGNKIIGAINRYANNKQLFPIHTITIE